MMRSVHGCSVQDRQAVASSVFGTLSADRFEIAPHERGVLLGRDRKARKLASWRTMAPTHPVDIPLAPQVHFSTSRPICYREHP